MRVLPGFFIALSVSLWTSAWASTNLDPETLGQLAQLERKFFTRSFDTDADDSRVQRLEKLVFGGTVAGDPAMRVKKLFGAAMVGPSPDGDAPVAGAPTVSRVEEPRPKPRVTNAPPDPKPSPDFSAGATTNSYPHIASLENVILGRSYGDQPLTGRIARMENKVFGKASSNPDLSQRTDALDDYVEQHLQQKSSSAGSSLKTASVTGVDPDSSGTKYPRITALEQAIMGETFEGQPLPMRLDRMETKAFGNPSSAQDLSDRADALENYTKKKLHKKTLDQQERSDTATASPQQGSGLPQKLLSMVGRSLLGIGAGGVPGAGGASGPGFAPSFGPSGFGRMGMHRQPGQQQQQQQPTPAPAPRPDDPAVHAANPPPAGTRFSTQVGWCEVQTFGHTFPEMHLAERLGQLNRELQFKPGKPDIELMDDMSGLIKAVQTQQQSRRATASAPGLGAH